MGVRAGEGFATVRFVLAAIASSFAHACKRSLAAAATALVLGLFAQFVHAVPVFTGELVTAPIPTNSDAPPVAVSLRMQQVLAGEAPIRVRVESIRVNGDPARTDFVAATSFTDSFGAVCLAVMYPGFQLGPNTVIEVSLIAVDNEQARAATTVRLVNGAARLFDPDVPADVAHCADAGMPPTANAGPDRTVPDTDGQPGESVTLTGSATGGLVERYEWLLGSTSLGTGATLIASLPDGANVATLRVTYVTGAVATDTATITVTAPPRQPPVANAGADQVVADTDGAPGESVTLDGRGSSDPDGTVASYIWRNAQQEQIATGSNPTVSLPNGVHALTLTVTDNDGIAASDTVQITVNAPQPPTATATGGTFPDTDGEPGESVTLTGSGTDSDGRIVRYEWFNGDASLGATASITPQLTDGTHTLRFVVTDNVGLTGTASVIVIVQPPPLLAPVADAGPDQTVEDTDDEAGELVTLTGTATDADGEIVSYEWTLGDATLGRGPTITVRLPDGVHVVALRVMDDDEQVDDDTVSITVIEPDTPEPQPPTANAGADRTVNDTDGEDGESVTLSGSATDPDGEIASYEWFLGERSLGTGATLTTRLANGTHDIRLVVIDDTELTDEDEVRIIVGAARAPTVDAGADRTVSDTDGEPGELVTLTGSATDPDGTIAGYEWLLGTTQLGTGASIQARLPDGVSTVTLRATDNAGLTATDTVQITVTREAQAPTANAGPDQSLTDTDGLPGEAVTLTGSGTDPDGSIATYEWRIGESVLGSGATLNARVPDGVSSVTLVVTDDAGLTASDSVQITVAAPVLPVVNAGVARTIADTDLQPGESVQLTGSATTQAGTITGYEWRLGDTLLGNGASINARLPDGVNVVTLRVTNSLNLVGAANVEITIGAPTRTVLADLPGLTPNERRLAAKLDEACGTVLTSEVPTTAPTPRESATVATKGRPPTPEDRADFAQKCRGLVYSRNTTALVDAMGELLGDDFAVARTQTLLFANTQYASVMDRLIALRGGARGLSLAGLNIIVDGELVPLAELQDLAKLLLGGAASSDADSWGENWGLWMRGNYSFGSKDEDALSPSFDADQYALLAGLDYRFSANIVGGAALAYGKSSVEFNPIEEGGLDTESWALSLYGSLYAKKNFYFDAIVNVADASYDAMRNITYVDGFGLVTTDAFGETGGLTMSAGVSGGYDFLIGGLTISPTIGVFYIDAQIDEFTEFGAGGLNLIYDEQQFKSFTGNIGMRATFSWNLPWGVLLPHFRADYVREFEDDVDVFGIRFASDPNAASTPPILVETENPDTSYWRFAAGFSAQFKHGISGYVEYQRLESFQFISFQDVSLGLRFQRSF